MPMRVITFKADDDFIESVNKFAKALGVDRSWLIRFALQQLMSRDLRELKKMTYNRYGTLGRIDLSRDIVCLDLSIDEILRLKKISSDPVQAIRHLIRLIPD